MTTSVSGRIEAVLERAGEAVNESRKGLDAQAEALGLMIEQSRSALTAIGSETAEKMYTNAAHMAARLGEIDGLMQKQRGREGKEWEGIESGREKKRGRGRGEE